MLSLPKRPRRRLLGQEVRFKQASRPGLCPGEYKPVKRCMKQVFYNCMTSEAATSAIHIAKANGRVKTQYLRRDAMIVKSSLAAKCQVHDALLAEKRAYGLRNASVNSEVCGKI